MQVEVSQLIPAGVVFPFAGPLTQIPAGYLLCNGQAVSRVAFARLFAAIGTGHGNGDGSTTFNVPDYLGKFLRGVDYGRGIDPDRASRTAMNPGGNTGDNVGSVQGDAMQGHIHQTSSQTAVVIIGGTNQTASGSNRNIGGAIQNVSPPVTDGSSGTPRTASETRPYNANVNYIIKW